MDDNAYTKKKTIANDMKCKGNYRIIIIVDFIAHFLLIAITRIIEILKKLLAFNNFLLFFLFRKYFRYF